jgi:hypothetical protein
VTQQHTPFTEEEVHQLEITLGDSRFEPLQHSPAMRLFAYENAKRVASEVLRLRRGDWIDAAAREIAADPRSCDISTSSAVAMAAIIRKHLRGGD